jgi:hypothetical protein
VVEEKFREIPKFDRDFSFSSNSIFAYNQNSKTSFWSTPTKTRRKRRKGESRRG